jgi:hypothetical protein
MAKMPYAWLSASDHASATLMSEADDVLLLAAGVPVELAPLLFEDATMSQMATLPSAAEAAVRPDKVLVRRFNDC